jgi:large subunit ribosomal protein L4
MLEVPVYNTSGEQVETLQVDEAVFGSEVNASLVKQAVVSYQANRRQGSVATKGRGMVSGSSKKLFRQKGTGHARRGTLRTGKVRGGGMTFAKTPRDFRQRMPRKMRKAALRSAILAKILGSDLLVVDGLAVEAPKTKVMADLLKNLQVSRSCLLTLAQRDANVYLSSRNHPDLTVRTAEELNAFDVATRQKLVVTKDAMSRLMGQEG